MVRSKPKNHFKKDKKQWRLRHKSLSCCLGLWKVQLLILDSCASSMMVLVKMHTAASLKASQGSLCLHWTVQKKVPVLQLPADTNIFLLDFIQEYIKIMDYSTILIFAVLLQKFRRIGWFWTSSRRGESQYCLRFLRGHFWSRDSSFHLQVYSQ